MSRSLDELLAAGDIHGIMRACHTRNLEREGIPMVLGLVDERRSIPRNTDDAQLAAGAVLAEALISYHRELVPFARDDDEGALVTAMQVVAFARFDPVTGAAASDGPRPDPAESSPARESALGPSASGDGLAEGVRI